MQRRRFCIFDAQHDCTWCILCFFTSLHRRIPSVSRCKDVKKHKMQRCKETRCIRCKEYICSTRFTTWGVLQIKWIIEPAVRLCTWGAQGTLTFGAQTFAPSFMLCIKDAKPLKGYFFAWGVSDARVQESAVCAPKVMYTFGVKEDSATVWRLAELNDRQINDRLYTLHPGCNLWCLALGVQSVVCLAPFAIHRRCKEDAQRAKKKVLDRRVKKDVSQSSGKSETVWSF